jgi:hypothetical protein
VQGLLLKGWNRHTKEDSRAESPTLVAVAAGLGNQTMVEVILEGVEEGGRDTLLQEAMKMALERHHPALVAWLVDKGALDCSWNPKAPPPFFARTPAMVAFLAQHGSRPTATLLEVLIEQHPSRPRPPDLMAALLAHTPRHHLKEWLFVSACHYAQLQVLTFLMDKDIWPSLENYPNPVEQLATHLIGPDQNPEDTLPLMARMMAHGIQAPASLIENLALEVARQKTDPENPDNVQQFLRNLGKMSAIGLTIPFHSRIFHALAEYNWALPSFLATGQWLLEQNVNIDEPDEQGQTALEAFCRSDRTSSERWNEEDTEERFHNFVNLGACVESKGKTSCLEIALERENTVMAVFLAFMAPSRDTALALYDLLLRKDPEDLFELFPEFREFLEKPDSESLFRKSLALKNPSRNLVIWAFHETGPFSGNDLDLMLLQTGLNFPGIDLGHPAIVLLLEAGANPGFQNAQGMTFTEMARFGLHSEEFRNLMLERAIKTPESPSSRGMQALCVAIERHGLSEVLRTAPHRPPSSPATRL